MGDEIWASPAIGSDGALYVGSLDDRFYSFSSTGALLWSYVLNTIFSDFFMLQNGTKNPALMNLVKVLSVSTTQNQSQRRRLDE